MEKLRRKLLFINNTIVPIIIGVGFGSTRTWFGYLIGLYCFLWILGTIECLMNIPEETLRRWEKENEKD
jgi:hypothetical protein